MDIGTLRHRIAIERNTSTTQDATGQVVPNWVVQATVWAEVVTLTGRELERARQQEAEVSHRVTLRFGVTIHAADRIAWGTRRLEVLAPFDPECRGRMLVILAREVT